MYELSKLLMKCNRDPLYKWFSPIILIWCKHHFVLTHWWPVTPDGFIDNIYSGNHYLKQCWLIRNVLSYSPQENFIGNTQDIIKMCLKITHLKVQPHDPRANGIDPHISHCNKVRIADFCQYSLGLISWMIFPSKFYFNESLFKCKSTVEYHITTKFCMSHDSIAVVPYAKFYSDYFTTTWMRAE